MSLHYDGPIISNCHNPQHKVIIFNEMTFKVGTFADNCGLSCSVIVCIKNGLLLQTEYFRHYWSKILKREDIFNVSYSSSLILDIYSVHFLSDLKS